MIKIILIIFFCCISAVFYAQNNNRQQEIRKQMAEIRLNTNWDNPVEAKKANERIKELSKELMGTGNASGSQSGGNQTEGEPESEPDKPDAAQEMNEQRMDLFSRIWELGMQGEGADYLIAKPIRDDIVEEYKLEDDQTVKNQDFMDKMTVLSLDMSMPGIDMVIDAMSSYKGITSLIITSRELTLNVDLAYIFKQAKEFPLEDLYIFNLGMAVTSIPPEIEYFKNIHTLSLLANGIKSLPQEISDLKQLKYLYVDHNPVITIGNIVSPIPGLLELGIAKTRIPQTEIEQIRETLPNCKILTE